MQANIDAFNHNVSGAGSIPCTGVGMCESIDDNLQFEDWVEVDNIVEFAKSIKKDGWVLWKKSDLSNAGIKFYMFKNENVDDYFIEAYESDGKCKACKVSYEFDDEDEEVSGRFEMIRSKSVPDSDGFMTDYTMYFDHDENKYVFVFGDSDMYSPYDGDYDWECDTYQDALEWFNCYDGFADELDESLTEDAEKEKVAHPVDVKDAKIALPDANQDAIIGDEDAGISALFIDAINECWSTIDNYHSIIVTLDSLDRHEFDETLQGLLEERNKEVGALQGILEMLSPASNQIEQGKEEAQDQISFDQIDEQFDDLEEDWEIFYNGKSMGKFKEEDPYDYTDRINSMYERVKKKYPDLSDDEFEEELRFELKDMFHGMRFERGNDVVIDSIVKKLLDNGKVNSVYGVESVRHIPRGISLREDLKGVNGKLEDFDPQELMNKALENKMPTHTERDFKGKLLYINIDPGHIFGQRRPNQKIWFTVIEEREDGSQERLLLDSDVSEEGVVNRLNDWKERYISSDKGNDNEEEV